MLHRRRLFEALSARRSVRAATLAIPVLAANTSRTAAALNLKPIDNDYRAENRHIGPGRLMTVNEIVRRQRCADTARGSRSRA